MAQPVQVQVKTLNAQAARAQLAHPVEMKKREVKSITLTIPLLSDKNSYLVVKMPYTAVQEAIRASKNVPEPGRTAFLRDWVMRNQQAVLIDRVFPMINRRVFLSGFWAEVNQHRR